MRDLRFLLKPKYSNSRALVIGIDNYKDAAPLSYAVSDASEVKLVLENELGFPQENTIFLTDSEATRENILRSFHRFTHDDIDLDERILVFFAGHGQTRSGIKGEIGYLVPHDARNGDLSTFIRWDELTRNAELVRAKHILFVMDACYGGLALSRTLGPGSTRFLKDMLLRYTRQVLTAGKANEVVADSGGPIPDHSIFTGHLIEGLRGNAATTNGIITANSLMAYVYHRVAHDTHSNQTPHYGYFDGDGDFIFRMPNASCDTDEKKDTDSLFLIPFQDENLATETFQQKIGRAKTLLADESSSIQLHDFIIDELKHFLAETDESHFPLQAGLSNEDLLTRFESYEKASMDLCGLLACISYWQKPVHRSILQRVLSRSTDPLESETGNRMWLALRWYPLILELYCAGIAAVEGNRYDSLADIFFAKTAPSDFYQDEGYFIENVTGGILKLTRLEAFKRLPGHERHYTPMSEYLFKILQPSLDDILFVGKSYERSFDEFEILLALVTADLRNQHQQMVWGPIGRFGWKQRNSQNPPLTKLVTEAKTLKNDWPPIRNGLFNGDFEHFLTVVDVFDREQLAHLNWH